MTVAVAIISSAMRPTVIGDAKGTPGAIDDGSMRTSRMFSV